MTGQVEAAHQDGGAQTPSLGHMGVVEAPGQNEPVAGLVETRQSIGRQRPGGQSLAGLNIQHRADDP